MGYIKNLYIKYLNKELSKEEFNKLVYNGWYAMGIKITMKNGEEHEFPNLKIEDVKKVLDSESIWLYVYVGKTKKLNMLINIKEIMLVEKM